MSGHARSVGRRRVPLPLATGDPPGDLIGELVVIVGRADAPVGTLWGCIGTVISAEDATEGEGVSNLWKVRLIPEHKARFTAAQPGVVMVVTNWVRRVDLIERVSLIGRV